MQAYGERSTSTVRPFLAAEEPRPRFDKFTSRRFIEESLKNLRRIYRVQENRLQKQQKEHHQALVTSRQQFTRPTGTLIRKTQTKKSLALKPLPTQGFLETRRAAPQVSRLGATFANKTAM